MQILHSTRSPLVPTYSLTANMMLQALPSRPTSAASSRPASPARAQQQTAQDRAGQQGTQHQQQQQQQQRPAWARRPTEQEPCGPAVQPAAQRQAEQQRPEWDVRNLRRSQGWSQPPSRAPSRGASRRQAGSTSLADSQPPVVPPTRVVAKMPAAGSNGTSGATTGAHTWGPARILQRHAVEQTKPLGTVGGVDDSGGFPMSLPCYQKQHIVNTGCTAAIWQQNCALVHYAFSLTDRCTSQRCCCSARCLVFWQRSMLLSHTVHVTAFQACLLWSSQGQIFAQFIRQQLSLLDSSKLVCIGDCWHLHPPAKTTTSCRATEGLAPLFIDSAHRP